MDIRRVNLSFNIENKEDREAYEAISNERFKTNFVCKAVLEYINCTGKDIITKKDLKNTIAEVLKELNINKINIENEENKTENELPKEIFDIFSQL